MIVGKLAGCIECTTDFNLKHFQPISPEWLIRDNLIKQKAKRRIDRSAGIELKREGNNAIKKYFFFMFLFSLAWNSSAFT
jgi:hypothetical protein